MKKPTIILFFLLFAVTSRSQNLVPNGDFEYYTSCPTWPNQTNFATPWYDPTGATSDYFNACAPVSSFVNVPDGTMGFWQYAYSGVGYVGLQAIQNVGSEYREYIQVELTDSLYSGECYKIIFYINLLNRVKKGCNNIGAYLSQTAITTAAPNVLNFSPQILLPGNPVITDTVNWIKISGLYIATGGEKYITIGNFENDSNTVTQIIDAASPYDVAYYYIDDVSVLACADTGVSVAEYENDFDFKIYPNPNDGVMILDYHLLSDQSVMIEVYDLTGRLLKTFPITSESTQLIINSTELNAGQYYYAIRINGQLVKTEKLTIIK